MTRKNNIKFNLIAALVVIALGGWLLHLRIHEPQNNPINWIPFFAGLASIIVIPAMFMFRKTVPWAYILNGMLVIIGSITMAHFSILHPPKIWSFGSFFINTLLPDIAILGTNFFLGKALFDLTMLTTLDATVPSSRFYRYPRTGWWGVHVVGLSFVYILGHLLWK